MGINPFQDLRDYLLREGKAYGIGINDLLLHTAAMEKSFSTRKHEAELAAADEQQLRRLTTELCGTSQKLVCENTKMRVEVAEAPPPSL